MASYSLKTGPKSFFVLMRALLGFSRDNCVGVARRISARVVQATAATSLLGTNSLVVFFYASIDWDRIV